MPTHDPEQFNGLGGGELLAQHVRIFLGAIMARQVAAMSDVKYGREGLDGSRASEQPYVERIPGVLLENLAQEHAVAPHVSAERLEPACATHASPAAAGPLQFTSCLEALRLRV